MVKRKNASAKKKTAKKTPTIFIVSGPGGAGKTTLVDKLLEKKHIKQNFIRSISATTRKRRPQETEAKDYIFIDKREFLILEKKGFFLENQQVLENHYGTPRFFFNKAKKEKKDLILCIDVKGGMYLKKNFKSAKIITIFVSAPDGKELHRRLKNRAEKEAFIKKRLDLAKKELQFAKYYDYLIVNQKIEDSLKSLESVLMMKGERR